MDDVGAQIQSTLRWLTRATVVLYAALILVSGYFWWDAHQTKTAVCTFRSDLQRRIDTSQQYLADHPDGVFGLTAAQIQASIDAQRQTVASLASAGC